MPLAQVDHTQKIFEYACHEGNLAMCNILSGARAAEAAASRCRASPVGNGDDSSDAAERNKQPILDAIRPWCRPPGLVLEIASGTGQHVVHFARALPALAWQPTEPDEHLLAAAIARASTRPGSRTSACRCSSTCSPTSASVGTRTLSSAST